MGSGERPAADAIGTLADVPISHALIHLRNKRLSGVLDLRAPFGMHAWVALWCGHVVTINTTPTVARFGTVVYEMKLIDAATLDATTVQSAREGRPQAEILVERGLLAAEDQERVAIEQTRRRIQHLFTLPPATTFSFREARPSKTSPSVTVDVLAPVWRSMRDAAPRWRVREVLDHVGDRPLRAIDEDVAEAAELDADESAVWETLAISPRTVTELLRVSDLPETRLETLVYFLLLARSVETIDGVRPAPATSTEMWAVSAPGDLPRATSRPPPRSESSARISSRSSALELTPEAVRRRAEHLAEESTYETLGLEQGASVEAVRAAWFRLGRVWNPAKLPPHLEEVRSEVERIYAHMTDAYRALSEGEHRNGGTGEGTGSSGR